MVTVDTLTAEYTQASIDGSVSGLAVVDGDLIATNFDSTEENLGNIQGEEGGIGLGGSTAIEVCTSSTRPALEFRFDGLHIYETDTGETLAWSGDKWLPMGGAGKPDHQIITPGGNLDVSSSSLSSWSPTAAVNVPDWAEYMQCTVTVSGMFAVTGGIGIGLALVFQESVFGEDVLFSFDNPSTRQATTWTDEIYVADSAGESATMRVYARKSVGIGTLRADTSSRFFFLHRFIARLDD